MRSVRYVGWLERHLRAVLVGSAIVVGVAAWLAVARLPLRADLSYLLPADAPAVRDAEKLAARVPAQDTMLAIVVAQRPAERAAAVAELVGGLRAIAPDLIVAVEDDDADTREFVRAHRHLFVPLDKLVKARDTLAQRIEDAKLRANPLYIDLDDKPAAPPAKLDDLHDAEAKLAKSAQISADGRMQVVVIRTPFRATDIERGRRLVTAITAIRDRVRADHPAATLGFAGGPVVTIAEHDALSRGVMLSSLITVVLVALVLLLHLRSLRLLVLLTINIVAATVVAFGLAALTVGHLNAATAFLGAIIAGNGVNYGILLAARYLDERRHVEASLALARAIAATLRPTLVASLGAAVAYGALRATAFRGFADFALIGGLGMLVCWVASFTLLPALMLRFARSPRRSLSPAFGKVVDTLFGFRRPALTCVVAGGAVLVSSVLAYRFLANDPYEYDLTKLRSRAPAALASRHWMEMTDHAVGHGFAGLGGQTYVAVDRAEDVPRVVDALHAVAAREPIVGPVRSILDVVPPAQPEKLAVLAALRTQIDDAVAELDEQDPERAELASERPPDDLRAITTRDLPPSLAARLAETDGQIGRIIAVRPSDRFDERNGHDLIEFASALRGVHTTAGTPVTAAGPALLFADVLLQIQSDGPLITALAVAGLVLVVVLLVGFTRRALAVLLAAASGSIAMVAVCGLLGLKVNFLDFVSLPITLGLGIDYAINVAHGDRAVGGTVLVCSLTTVIGYASLLVSDNLAIRGFGLAALIGEITCVVAALVIVPAVLGLRRPSARAVNCAASQSV